MVGKSVELVDKRADDVHVFGHVGGDAPEVGCGAVQSVVVDFAVKRREWYWWTLKDVLAVVVAVVSVGWEVASWMAARRL